MQVATMAGFAVYSDWKDYLCYTKDKGRQVHGELQEEICFSFNFRFRLESGFDLPCNTFFKSDGRPDGMTGLA